MNDHLPRIVILPEEVDRPIQPPSASKSNEQEPAPATRRNHWLVMLLISIIPFYNAWCWWRVPLVDVTQRRLARAGSLILGAFSFVLLAATIAWLWPRDWIEEAITKAEYSVVQIYQGDNLAGTGVVIASHGNRHLILTNKHVIGESNSLVVASRVSAPVGAQLVGLASREDIDLALLVVQCEGLRPLSRIAAFDSIRTGEHVVAIGHPYELNYTVTEGIVSSKREGIYVQTSAAINPGNSGGPLINNRSALIAINTITGNPAISHGLGFSVRADWVLKRDEWILRENIDDLLERIPH